MEERKFLTEDDLLAKRADTASGLPEDDVEVPFLGGWVTVRGLRRDEVIGVRQAADNDPQTLDGKRVLVLERKMMALAMIQPRMSESKIAQWQTTAVAGELTPVTDKIQELSGMTEGASKSGVPGAGERPGDRVRDVPGDETVDDGGAAAGPAQ